MMSLNPEKKKKKQNKRRQISENYPTNYSKSVEDQRPKIDDDYQIICVTIMIHAFLLT